MESWRGDGALAPNRVFDDELFMCDTWRLSPVSSDREPRWRAGGQSRNARIYHVDEHRLEPGFTSGYLGLFFLIFYVIAALQQSSKLTPVSICRRTASKIFKQISESAFDQGYGCAHRVKGFCFR
jgi:hypothetical protein